MTALSECKALQSLVLESPCLDAQEISALAACAQLVRLELKSWRIPVPKEGKKSARATCTLSAFKVLTQLRRLSLKGCIAPEAEYTKLGDLPKLEYLDLSETAVDDVRLVVLLGKLAALKSLNLSGCAKIDGCGFIKFAEQAPDLAELNLSGSGIDDETISLLTGSKALRLLYLGSCTKLTAAAVQKASQLKQLEEIGLKGVPVSDSGLKSLAHCEKLRAIDLSGCPGYSDEGLLALLVLKQLKTVSGTQDNKALTREARAQLERHCEANARR